MDKDKVPHWPDLGLAATFTNAQFLFPSPASLAQGSTASDWVLDLSSLGVPAPPEKIRDADRPLQRSTTEPVHNPMLAFWYRAVFFFNAFKKLSEQGYTLLFEDFALVISDLGLSLYMLLGRHWNDKAKAEWRRTIGNLPGETPDALELLEKYFPRFGWNLPEEDAILWARVVTSHNN